MAEKRACLWTFRNDSSLKSDILLPMFEKRRCGFRDSDWKPSGCNLSRRKSSRCRGAMILKTQKHCQLQSRAAGILWSFCRIYVESQRPTTAQTEKCLKILHNQETPAGEFYSFWQLSCSVSWNTADISLGVVSFLSPAHFLLFHGNTELP